MILKCSSASKFFLHVLVDRTGYRIELHDADTNAKENCWKQAGHDTNALDS